MKNHSTLAFASFIFICFLGSACKGDDPTKVEKYTKLLSQSGGQWEPAVGADAITLDGIDVQDEFFTGFTIKFTETQIITTGTSPLWVTPDTWSFQDEKAEVIVRGSDYPPLTVVSLTATELVIEMEWTETTYEGGRVASLPGVYTFILSKQ